MGFFLIIQFKKNKSKYVPLLLQDNVVSNIQQGLLNGLSERGLQISNHNKSEKHIVDLTLPTVPITELYKGCVLYLRPCTNPTLQYQSPQRAEFKPTEKRDKTPF